MRWLALFVLAVVLVGGLWGAYSAAKQMQHAVAVNAAKVN